MTPMQYAGAAILVTVLIYGMILDYRDYKSRMEAQKANRDLARAITKKQ